MTDPPTTTDTPSPTLDFVLDGVAVSVSADGATLLEVLRDRLGSRSPKDGCSPQGQCGCCTVLVDGQPRVACVTPAARIAGRSVTTLEGLDPGARDTWLDAFTCTGASQCGFCTPGIVVRLAGQAADKGGGGPLGPDQVRRALLAHLCRCTGWQTIVEAAALIESGSPVSRPDRDLAAAGRRATLEGRSPQRVGSDVAAGQGGFADDTAAPDALVALRDTRGEWVVAETLHEARALAGKVQGRRTTVPISWPLSVPEGDWTRTLATTWVEPAYLEPDATWCRPGEKPVTPLANGGAFGGKTTDTVRVVARSLAAEHGRPVRVLWTREDVVRLGPKRPPIAAGIDANGHGRLRVVNTPGAEALLARIAPGIEVEQVVVPGPPTSLDARAALWAEVAVLLSSLRSDGPDEVVSPDGAWAAATVDDAGVRLRVRCGDPLDEVVLRSYCIGAAHMALGWVRSESIRVDDAGEVHDLTIRSFGVLRAVDTPPITVEIEPSDGEPVNGSDAVFAAVAAAAWRHAGYPPAWPTSA